MANIPYHRAPGRKLYLSITKHQKNGAGNHSKWLSVPIERQTFDAGDYGNHNQVHGNQPWLDSNGKLWGFLNDFQYVGTENQQFGFFDYPNNLTVSCHGFPVFPFSKPRFYISQDLLERWVEEGYIDEDDIEDIINRKRIR